MPRRNKPLIQHLRFRLQSNEDMKRAYPSEHAANSAAEIAMLQHPRLELYVYKPHYSRNWYLTSKPPESYNYYKR